MEFKVVRIEKLAEVNFILGQSHFIKTVKDLHETLVGTVPGIRFGLAFCESSGECLVRWTGTDEEMIRRRSWVKTTRFGEKACRRLRQMS